MKGLTEKLKPLYDATVEMSAEKVFTGSKYLPMTKTILAWYHRDASIHQAHGLTKDFSIALKQTLQRRFQGVEDNKELCLATLLDPRFKEAGKNTF